MLACEEVPRKDRRDIGEFNVLHSGGSCQIGDTTYLQGGPLRSVTIFLVSFAIHHPTLLKSILTFEELSQILFETWLQKCCERVLAYLCKPCSAAGFRKGSSWRTLQDIGQIDYPRSVSVDAQIHRHHIEHTIILLCAARALPFFSMARKLLTCQEPLTILQSLTPRCRSFRSSSH
jgi:hypothetical protein